MECQNCELKQRQFYCENCLKQHLYSLRTQTQRVIADRDAHISTAQQSLGSVVDPARLRRAELKGREERVRELWDGVNTVRISNDQARERVRTLRNSLSARRRTLAIASSTFIHPHASSSASSTSTSASPPHAPISTSAQSVRPITHRRTSSTLSSRSPTPSSTPSPVPRISTPSSRPAYPFPSSSSQGLRSPLTPPQAFTTRPSLTSPTSTSPHSFPLTRNNHGMSPAGPHAAQDRATDALTRQIDEATSQLVALSDTIARARSGLVQELVEVFSVVEVGGRPPLGGKAGTKGEWTIGGLVLPVPGDIRRYPPDHINAVLTHTLHFLSLLAFYLGIKLPFEVIWSRSSTPPSSSSSTGSGNPKGNGLLGVGVPWIGACKGGESGGWARWSTKQPLHVSSSPAAPSATTTPPPSSPSRPTPHSRSMTTPAPSASSPITKAISLSASSLADSQLADEPPSTSAHGSAFTTALAMLLYDVCYLAHTQAVEVPLAQAGEVLGNLWAVCCSPELGRRSHATSPLLPAPTPPTFPLDFAQLLQATAANPTRPRARGTSGKAVRRTERIIEEDEDGWDLVDADVRANI